MAEPVNGATYLYAGRVRGRRGHDRGVLERAGVLQRLADLGNGRALLPDGDVDALDLPLRVAGVPVALLVDDRVDGDRRLAGLPVTDDQLALAAPDGGDRVDRLDPALQRGVHLLALHHRRRLQLQRAQLGVLDRSLAVQRGAERVHHPAQEAVADRDRQDLAGPPDLLALVDLAVVAEDDHADLAHVEVQREAAGAVLELKQLVGHGRGQALDPGDAVAALGDGADLVRGHSPRLIRLDEMRQRIPDLIGPDCQLRHLPAVSLVLIWYLMVWVWLLVLRPTAGRSGSGGQPAPELGEPARQAAVDELVAGLDGHAADDLRVEHYVQVHVMAVGGRQRRPQPGGAARP